MLSQNLVVLGCTSYIGNVFYQHALTRNRCGGSDSINRWNVIAASSRECNLLDENATVQFFSSLPNSPTVVVCFSVINKSVGNSYESFTDNLKMATNLVRGCSFANISSLVYVGSVDIFGVAPVLPITEKTQINPDTWYGLAKYNCEWIVRTEVPAEMSVSVVRVPGVFGSAPNDRSIIGKFVREIQTSGSVVLSGTGNEQRDYVWVEDVSRFLLEIVERQPRVIVNAVTGISYTLAEIARRIGEVLKLPVTIVSQGGKSDRDFDLVFNNALLQELLPDFSFSTLEDGIRSYLLKSIKQK